MKGRSLGLVCASAGGVEEVRGRLIEPLLEDGWTVAVTATPTAATWLQSTGESQQIETATGLPLRYTPRMPGEASPHPPVDCYALVPGTANTVAKLALGIADNQALTQLCEAVGTGQPPVTVFPRVNAGHAGQPAWKNHLDALTQAGIRLIYGEDVWPLHEPRSAPGRHLPWQDIRRAIEQTISIEPDETERDNNKPE